MRRKDMKNPFPENMWTEDLTHALPQAGQGKV